MNYFITFQSLKRYTFFSGLKLDGFLHISLAGGACTTCVGKLSPYTPNSLFCFMKLLSIQFVIIRSLLCVTAINVQKKRESKQFLAEEHKYRSFARLV